MLTLLALCFCLGTTLVGANEPKLLVVSYDAFRYDYFRRNLNPYMSSLRNAGVHSDYMINVFYTKTFPNHQSMSTGLYVDYHGVIDNEFYDENTKKKYMNSPELYGYDKNITPIWALNEQNGKRSGSMMWPGSMFGANITFLQDLDNSMNFTSRIDTLISWFKDEKTPINFGLLYIEEPDKRGHAVGINSPLFDDMLKIMDQTTIYLHKQLVNNGLEDVNVIHLSDHGMVSVTYKNVIYLEKYVNMSDFEVAGTGPGLHIFPNPGKLDELYKKLTTAANEHNNFEVYLREDIPKRYHYNNHRIGRIFVLAKKGYTFYTLLKSIPNYEKEFNLTITNETEFGIHGYDNMEKEMRPFFFANGPAFRENCKLKPFYNLDLYPLFCEILQIQCPPNNGTIDELKNCLISYAPVEKIIRYDLVLIGVVVLMVISTIGAFLYRYIKTRKARSNYRMIINIQDAEHMWDEK